MTYTPGRVQYISRILIEKPSTIKDMMPFLLHPSSLLVLDQTTVSHIQVVYLFFLLQTHSAPFVNVRLKDICEVSQCESTHARIHLCPPRFLTNAVSILIPQKKQNHSFLHVHVTFTHNNKEWIHVLLLLTYSSNEITVLEDHKNNSFTKNAGN